MSKCCQDSGHFRKLRFQIPQASLFFQCVLYCAAVILIKQSPQRKDGAFLRCCSVRNICRSVDMGLPQHRPLAQQQPVKGDAASLCNIYA